MLVPDLAIDRREVKAQLPRCSGLNLPAFNSTTT